MGQPSDKTGTPSGIDCAAEDPKLREKPAPTGNGIDTPPKVTKLGRETSRHERCCVDWVNARLSSRPLARLHPSKTRDRVDLSQMPARGCRARHANRAAHPEGDGP
jgi:hypothetical protein